MQKNYMQKSKRFKTCQPEQGELLPTYTSDLVPEDHLARVVNDVVDLLNLECLYSKYSIEGGSTYHPKPLLKILFYTYADGTRSSRRIAKMCRENLVYFYLGGGYKPDHRTVNDFRKNNLDTLKTLFNQIVKICFELKMISIGRISIDGTKVKAQASNNNVICRDKLQEELNRIEVEISQMFDEAEAIDKQEDNDFGAERTGEELPTELQNARQRKEKIKEQIALLDEHDVDKLNPVEPEARFMKTHGRRDLCFNGQIATENQVVLACNLNNATNDLDQVEPIVEDLEEIARDLLGKQEHPLEGVKGITDAGYDSGKTMQYFEKAKIDGYVANHLNHVRAREERGEIAARPFHKDKFKYISDEDCYQCPAGAKLFPVKKKTEKKKSYTRHDVVYKTDACLSCEFQNKCTTSKTGCRQVSRYLEYDSFREAMDRKMKTDAGKAEMRHRFKDVEPTFGQIKEGIFRRNPFLLRGEEKAKGEFTLSCAVHNIKKIKIYLLSDDNNYNFKDIAKIKAQMAG